MVHWVYDMTVKVLDDCSAKNLGSFPAADQQKHRILYVPVDSKVEIHATTPKMGSCSGNLRLNVLKLLLRKGLRAVLWEGLLKKTENAKR